MPKAVKEAKLFEPYKFFAIIEGITKCKPLVLDLDGTTVEPRGDALPSAKVIEKVQQAQEKVHVAVATGRPLPYAQPVLDALKLQGLGVVNGGAEIVDMKKGEVVYVQKIDRKTLQDLVRLCLPFGCDIYLSTDQYDSSLTSPEDVTDDTEKLFISAIKNG